MSDVMRRSMTIRVVTVTAGWDGGGYWNPAALIRSILPGLSVSQQQTLFSNRRRATQSLSRAQLGRVGLLLSGFMSIALLGIFSSVPAMVELTENEMSEVSGQALMQMAKTPGEVGTVSQDITFYRAGLNAAMEINMNIEKLQLGCTANAINGQYCDIDIDHLSLSGASWDEGRPNSSALLTRPFIEFAIDNDGTPFREVVGFRLSAENASGLLTMGHNDGAGNEMGINSLSGYMVTTPVTGVAQTAPANFAGPGDPYQTELVISATINALGLTGDLVVRTDPSQGTGIELPSMSVPFQSATGAVINERRATSTSLDVTGTIPQIFFPPSSNNNPTTELRANRESCSGSICGLVGSGYWVYANQGSVNGLELAATFNQSLGFIHKIEVDSPFSLSFQSDPVKWPGTAAANVAQQGWWMSFEDMVELGDVSPSELVDITQAFPQLGTALQAYFSANPIDLGLGQAWSGLTAGYMNVNMPNMHLQNDIPGGTPPLGMTLEDLRLGAQDVVPNCWGGARFC